MHFVGFDLRGVPFIHWCSESLERVVARIKRCIVKLTAFSVNLSSIYKDSTLRSVVFVDGKATVSLDETTDRSIVVRY